MIKFFRKIRQNLLTENKFSRYLIYAIGEIILVVIGILIAIQINNWNESLKLKQKKQELIANLIEDFEENNIQLKLAIKNSESLNNKMSLFIIDTYLNDKNTSIDSIKTLANSFFKPISFFPLTTTYDEAMANGNITLINSKKLSRNFALFQERYSFFLNMKNQYSNSFFRGSTYELKKTIGSTSLILNNKSYISQKKKIDYYNNLISSPQATIAIENQFIINSNINSTLKEMDSISINIIKNLNELK